MLIGEYTHAIDDKNRLSLPAKFRAELGKKIVLTPGLDGCLWVFTVKQWEDISSKLSESSFLQKDSRSFNRYLLGGAVETEIDGAGRILVPDFLKERSGLSEKAVLIGVRTRVEIWSEKMWKQMKVEVEKEADLLAEKLGTIGISL